MRFDRFVAWAQERWSFTSWPWWIKIDLFDSVKKGWEQKNLRKAIVDKDKMSLKTTSLAWNSNTQKKLTGSHFGVHEDLVTNERPFYFGWPNLQALLQLHVSDAMSKVHRFLLAVENRVNVEHKIERNFKGPRKCKWDPWCDFSWRRSIQSDKIGVPWKCHSFI